MRLAPEKFGLEVMAGAALLVAAAAIPAARAWAESSVWDGIFSAAQVRRGHALYDKQCASCHLASLEGHGTSPSLAGAEFRDRWDGQTVDDLFEKIQETMPGDHPGSLTRTDNAAILAYILAANEFPQGDADLRSDSESLGKILFKAVKDK